MAVYKFPRAMQQPVLGIVWTGFLFAAGGLNFYVGVQLSKMDLVAFMITIPVPFISGTIVVLNMLGAPYATARMKSGPRAMILKSG